MTRVKKPISVRHESRVAAALGGRVRPGSGNQWMAKGDVITSTELLSCKATDKASRSLKLAEWIEIMHQAIDERRTPLLALCVTDRYGREHDFIAMSLDDYVAMRNHHGQEQKSRG